MEQVNQSHHHQQAVSVQHNHDVAVGAIEVHHHSVDDGQDNNDSTISALHGSITTESGIVKTPNSYKYPQLKRYFEFGPWIGRNRKALCLGCRLQTSSSQPDRLLKHLNRCTALSDADKVIVQDLMNERTANKRKKPMQLRLKRGENDDDTEYYGDDEPNTDGLSSGHNSISIPAGGLKKMRRDHPDRKSRIDEALTRFIMVCRIPLKAIHSREFVELVHSLDPEYHIPSRENITNVLIPGLLNII